MVRAYCIDNARGDISNQHLFTDNPFIHPPHRGNPPEPVWLGLLIMTSPFALRDHQQSPAQDSGSPMSWSPDVHLSNSVPVTASVTISSPFMKLKKDFRHHLVERRTAIGIERLVSLYLWKL